MGKDLSSKNKTKQEQMKTKSTKNKEDYYIIVK